MDKVKYILFIFSFWLVAGCNTKPDFTSEIKAIDSLETEVNKSLAECKIIDTSWINPVTRTSNYNVKMIKQVYNPDTLLAEETSAISYYKGFRKVGMNFKKQRKKLMDGFQKTLLQLKDLKTDAENGALKKEDLDKYILEEEAVTTELIFLFNDLKYSSKEILKNYDSLNPMIEKIIEVYKVKYDESEKNKKGKSGITLH